MSFNSSSVSIGEVTKKSHFDRLMSNLFSLLKDDHTFEGTKTFNSGTVFTFAPTLPSGSIETIHIKAENVTLPKLVRGADNTYLQGKGAGADPAYDNQMPPLTTKGDLIVQGAAVPERKATGIVGQVFHSPGAGSVPAWKDLFNLLTTQGDLWVRGAADPERLAAGASGTYLRGQGSGVLPSYENINLDEVLDGSSYVRLAVGSQTIQGQKNFSGTVELYSTFKVDEIITNSATNAVAIQAIHRSATSSSETTVKLKTKVIEIGSWDMDAVATKQVNHGFADITKIRSVTGVIRKDDDTIISPFGTIDTISGDPQIGTTGIGTISLGLFRGSDFDNTNYNDTSINRGWITFIYEA